MRTIEACCFADAGAAFALNEAACGKRGGGVSGETVCASPSPTQPAAGNTIAHARKKKMHTCTQNMVL
jgi:hypothetical protein